MTSVVDVVRTYMDAASGLTRLTRQRAVVAAKTLLKVEDRFAGEAPARDGSEEATRGSVGAGIQSLASELVATSAANRDALSELVHSEMDRVLHETGYVRREDHDRLLRRVADLERRLAAFNSSPAVRAGEAAPSGTGEPDPPEAAKPGSAAPESPTQPRVSEPEAPEPDTAATVPADPVGETPEGSATGSETSSEPEGASTRSARTGGKPTTKTTGRSRSTKKSSTGKSGKSK